MYPGAKNASYVSPSDEHNERGEVISDVFTDPVMRKKMVEKRMRKMDVAMKEISKLFPVKLEGSADADVTLVGWGSTYNLLNALMRRLEEEGTKTNILMIKVIAPFLSDEVSAILSKCKHPIIIENNFTSQMAPAHSHGNRLRYQGQNPEIRRGAVPGRARVQRSEKDSHT